MPPPGAPPQQQNTQDIWMPKTGNQSLFSPRSNKVDVINDHSWGDHAPGVAGVPEESKEQESGLSDLENVIGMPNSGRSDQINRSELEKPRSKQRNRRRKDQKGNQMDGFESEKKSFGVQAEEEGQGLEFDDVKRHVDNQMASMEKNKHKDQFEQAESLRCKLRIVVTFMVVLAMIMVGIVAYYYLTTIYA